MVLIYNIAMKNLKLTDVIFFILVIGLIISSFVEFDLSENKEARSNTYKKMYEKDYVDKYCDGIKEYVLPDKTRVDCLTNEYAIEFDYAKKWAESVGQSLYYAEKTGKKPAVAIILSKETDKKYVKRINDIDRNIKIFEIYAVDYEK